MGISYGCIPQSYTCTRRAKKNTGREKQAEKVLKSNKRGRQMERGDVLRRETGRRKERQAEMEREKVGK